MLPNFELTGRSCLIIGGSSGIGLTLAGGLLNASAKVTIAGREQGKPAAARAKLCKTYIADTAQMIEVLQLGARKPSALEAAATELEQRNQQIDILINC